jgi:hypothetical protein
MPPSGASGGVPYDSSMLVEPSTTSITVGKMRDALMRTPAHSMSMPPKPPRPASPPPGGL